MLKFFKILLITCIVALFAAAGVYFYFRDEINIKIRRVCVENLQKLTNLDIEIGDIRYSILRPNTISFKKIRINIKADGQKNYPVIINSLNAKISLYSLITSKAPVLSLKFTDFRYRDIGGSGLLVISYKRIDELINLFSPSYIEKINIAGAEISYSTMLFEKIGADLDLRNSSFMRGTVLFKLNDVKYTLGFTKISDINNHYNVTLRTKDISVETILLFNDTGLIVREFSGDVFSVNCNLQGEVGTSKSGTGKTYAVSGFVTIDPDKFLKTNFPSSENIYKNISCDNIEIFVDCKMDEAKPEDFEIKGNMDCPKMDVWNLKLDKPSFDFYISRDTLSFTKITAKLYDGDIKGSLFFKDIFTVKKPVLSPIQNENPIPLVLGRKKIPKEPVQNFAEIEKFINTVNELQRGDRTLESVFPAAKSFSLIPDYLNCEANNISLHELIADATKSDKIAQNVPKHLSSTLQFKLTDSDINTFELSGKADCRDFKVGNFAIERAGTSFSAKKEELVFDDINFALYSGSVNGKIIVKHPFQYSKTGETLLKSDFIGKIFEVLGFISLNPATSPGAQLDEAKCFLPDFMRFTIKNINLQAFASDVPSSEGINSNIPSCMSATLEFKYDNSDINTFNVSGSMNCQDISIYNLNFDKTTAEFSVSKDALSFEIINAALYSGSASGKIVIKKPLGYAGVTASNPLQKSNFLKKLGEALGNLHLNPLMEASLLSAKTNVFVPDYLRCRVTKINLPELVKDMSKNGTVPAGLPKVFSSSLEFKMPGSDINKFELTGDISCKDISLNDLDVQSISSTFFISKEKLLLENLNASLYSGTVGGTMLIKRPFGYIFTDSSPYRLDKDTFIGKIYEIIGRLQVNPFIKRSLLGADTDKILPDYLRCDIKNINLKHFLNALSKQEQDISGVFGCSLNLNNLNSDAAERISRPRPFYMKLAEYEGFLHVTADNFTIKKFKTDYLTGTFSLNNNKLVSENMAGSVYGGKLAGSVNAKISNDISYVTKFSLTGLSIREMMHDLSGKEDDIYGKVDAKLNLNGPRISLPQMKGTLDIDVHDADLGPMRILTPLVGDLYSALQSIFTPDEVVKINAFTGDFTIRDSAASTTDSILWGNGLCILAQGQADFAGKLDFSFENIVIDPTLESAQAKNKTELRDSIVKMGKSAGKARLKGTVKKPAWSFDISSIIQNNLDHLFKDTSK
ncbi:MAG: hypothetical protein HQL28_03020 [Candidatus Omnitrophica bacterium]|nr:hypothetical protein [Candidatus Omnitrophota bacterium]